MKNLFDKYRQYQFLLIAISSAKDYVYHSMSITIKKDETKDDKVMNHHK